MKKVILILIIICMTCIGMWGTTWDKVEVECPICHSMNTFEAPMSYGSYIYWWESKFQYIYWPATDWRFIYQCEACNFAAMMMDFRNVADSNKSKIRMYLNQGSFDNFDGEEKSTTMKLLDAEKYYQVLGYDDVFWSEYYRIIAYHFEEEGNPVMAKQYRSQAVEVLRPQITNGEHVGEEKEFYYILAGMKFLLNETDSCTYYLDKASSLTYTNKEYSEQSCKDNDIYLDSIIVQFRKMMSEKNIPSNE